MVVIVWAALYGDYGRSKFLSTRILITSILSGLQMLTLVLLMGTICAIQRRPAVFSPDDRNVDRQRTVSLWSRYSFQWCLNELRIAGNDKLENSNLPAMDHIARSKDALWRFQNMVPKESSLPLWALIAWEFRGPLLWQWSIILLSNFFDVAPTFATLQLLKYLETRGDTDSLDPSAWKYVVAIAAATTSSYMIDSRIMWSSQTGMIIDLL
jgi:hypothetical protein